MCVVISFKIDASDAADLLFIARALERTSSQPVFKKKHNLSLTETEQCMTLTIYFERNEEN